MIRVRAYSHNVNILVVSVFALMPLCVVTLPNFGQECCVSVRRSVLISVKKSFVC